MLNRAYSTFEIKSVDEDKRIVEGFTSTPTPDRIGDVLDPKGAEFKLPLPLLWQHQSDKPIGHVLAAKVSDDGIWIKAQIEKGVLPFIDEAWALIKAKLVRGFSVGWRPQGEPKASNGTFLWPKWEWIETSAVTIPMNREATIALIKSADAPFLAATGTETARVSSSGVTERPRRAVSLVRKDTSMKKAVSEQIQDLENKRAAHLARVNEIQAKANEDNRTKEGDEKDEFDRLRAEIKTFDEELVDLRDLEELNKKSAVSVDGSTAAAASESRDRHSSIAVSGPKLPPGMGFARAVKSTVVARLDGRNVLDVAKEMYPSDERLHKHLVFMQNLPRIIMQLKAAVPAATTANSLWAGALVDPTNLPGEFVEFLRPATIIGRLNLRDIPTNVRLIEQTQGGTGYWVGQGAPKPLTAFGYAPITLSPTKVAAIAVATEESLRFSSPSLDTLIRDGLRDALIERVDLDLLDPSQAGTANVQPAALTSGVTPLTSAGTSADNIRTDLGTLVRTLRTANLRGSIAIVLPDSLLTAMAWMVNSLGQPEFPGLTGDGGTFNGIRFIGSEYLANESGAGNMVVAIAEREVFVSNDGGVRVDASREASLQMLDNPTNNSATATPTTMISMWQTNSVAFRGEWFINWQKRRATAVAYIDDVNWGSIGSP